MGKAMMKILWALLLCLISMPAMAQTADHTVQAYSMRYVKDHLFMQQGDDFNVIDTYVEWPDVLAHSLAHTKPLQRWLIKKMLDFDSADFDSAYTAFKNRYGKPVAGQLKDIPDDRRFCYITVEARVKSYSPGRWISYKVTCRTEPGSLSSVKAQNDTQYYIYDIGRKKTLSTEGFIRQDWVQEDNMSDEFFFAVFAPLSDDDMDRLSGAAIHGVWPEPKSNDVGFSMMCRTPDEELSYETLIPYPIVRPLLTKDARQLLGKSIAKIVPDNMTLPLTWNGDSIYKTVDTLPVFRGGQEKLKDYFAREPEPKNPMPGRVMVSFVVDKAGGVQDVRVVTPLSPELDRHAVELVKGMPRFTPGSLRGEHVNVRIYLPIVYKGIENYE